MVSRSMKDVGGAVLAGSTPPFLGRERAAVDVDVGPERRGDDDDVLETEVSQKTHFPAKVFV